MKISYNDWFVIEHNAKKIIKHWRTHPWCNSIYYAQCKQWEFMHFEDFSYFFKHSIQINILEKNYECWLLNQLL